MQVIYSTNLYHTGLINGIDIISKFMTISSALKNVVDLTYDTNFSNSVKV